MNILVDLIAGMGVPGLILLSMISSSPFVGGPALMNALKRIGLGISSLAGIFVLVGVAFASFGVAEISTRELTKAVLRRKLSRGYTEDELIKQVNSLPVSCGFKKSCETYLEDIKLARQMDNLKKFVNEYS